MYGPYEWIMKHAIEASIFECEHNMATFPMRQKVIHPLVPQAIMLLDKYPKTRVGFASL